MNISKTSTYLSFLALLIFMGCAVEPVELKGISNVHVDTIDGNAILVNADALLYNPNSNSGKITNVEIAVFYKGKEIAQVREVENVKVAAKKDFTMPMEMSIDMKVFQEDNWLQNLASIISGKSAELHFKGDIRIKILGVGRSIPVDYKETLKF